MPFNADVRSRLLGWIIFVFLLNGVALGADKDNSDPVPRERQIRQLEEEIQQATDEIALQYRKKYYPDELLQGYINDLGQSLVPRETPSGVLFSFRVVNDPLPNAVALADGRVFIHSGLLTFVENEAQLAMVLAHEVAHVTRRHTIEAIRASRSLKRGLFTALAGLGTLAATRDRNQSEKAAGLVSAAMAAHFSRKQEMEADLLACRLVMTAGFDPMEGEKFFKKLARTFGDDSRLANFLVGTHPLKKDRAANVRRLVSGELSSLYNDLRSAAKLSVGSGRFKLIASGMIRDSAVVLAERYDRYDLAKTLLESILDVRAHDPRTLWYLLIFY